MIDKQVMDRPLLICLSATRNYGWVTRAFCQANSQWADYIIIVDQMSTDDTREICAEYEKVILLDDHDLSYSETRRCKMALNRAREIDGDKILIYLAVDEVLPANWMETKDGKMVLQSKSTDMFLIEWANLLPGSKHYTPSQDANMYRVFHDDGLTPYDNQTKDMHTHCLPYHIRGLERKIEDFPILHFGYYNQNNNYVKHRYYQMVDYDKTQHSIIALSRYYYFNPPKNPDYSNRPVVKSEWFWKEFDIFTLVDTESTPVLIQECKKYIDKNGTQHYAKLDIWDELFVSYIGVADPRSWWMKALHRYLRSTYKIRSRWYVQLIDKVLKRIV